MEYHHNLIVLNAIYIGYDEFLLSFLETNIANKGANNQTVYGAIKVYQCNFFLFEMIEQDDKKGIIYHLLIIIYVLFYYSWSKNSWLISSYASIFLIFAARIRNMEHLLYI